MFNIFEYLSKSDAIAYFYNMSYIVILYHAFQSDQQVLCLAAALGTEINAYLDTMILNQHNKGKFVGLFACVRLLLLVNFLTHYGLVPEHNELSTYFQWTYLYTTHGFLTALVGEKIKHNHYDNQVYAYPKIAYWKDAIYYHCAKFITHNMLVQACVPTEWVAWITATVIDIYPQAVLFVDKPEQIGSMVVAAIILIEVFVSSK